MIDTILITGCARSGNTLVSFLVATGFKNILRTPKETSPVSWRKKSKSSKIVCGKKPKYVTKVTELLSKNPDLAVICMVRDPRAVLISHHGLFARKRYVNSTRWIKACESIVAIPDCYKDRCLTVKFEDIILDPDLQQDVIGSHFGLVEAMPFSQCHNHMNVCPLNFNKLLTKPNVSPTDFVAMGNNKSINPDRAKPWKDGSKIVKDKRIKRLMEKFGYV